MHPLRYLFKVILFEVVIIIINNGSVSFFLSFCFKEIVIVERGNYDSLNREKELRIKKNM